MSTPGLSRPRRTDGLHMSTWSRTSGRAHGSGDVRIRTGRGNTDLAYRELLVTGFQLDVDEEVRTLSHGDRQKVQLIAAFASRADLLVLDDHRRIGSAHGGDVAGHAHEAGVRPRRSSCRRMSEVEALLIAVGFCVRGELVDQGTLRGLRHLSAQTIEVTFEGDAPSLPELPGVQVDPGRRERVALRGERRRRATAAPSRSGTGCLAREPHTITSRRCSSTTTRRALPMTGLADGAPEPGGLAHPDRVVRAVVLRQRVAQATASATVTRRRRGAACVRTQHRWQRRGASALRRTS